VALRPVKVSNPAPESDQPKLIQVGVIAAVCFAIGALWPTLSGLRLVPEVPSQSDDKPKAAPRPPHDPAEPPSTSAVPVSGLAVNENGDLPANAVGGGSVAAVSKELIVNCHDDQDRKLSQCDKPAFEAIAKERLQALTSCEPAKGATGTLSIGFDLDFEKEKITRVLKGKSTTFSDEVAEALVACAKREFLTATLRGVEHTHAKYLVFYMVELAAPSIESAPSDQAPVVQASGTATIIWNSARIRSTPDDGEVVSRILYGTRVVVTGRQEDWYRVRYDAKGNEGWVHKNALAM
jgi:Bacterial SH3 domain